MKYKLFNGKRFPVQIVDGEEVPVITGKTKDIIKNKRTGKIYESQADFDKDVKDPTTDTTKEDFRQDVEITVASLSVFGKTK